MRTLLSAVPMFLLAATLTAQEVIDESQMNNKDQATSALDAIRGRVAGLTVEKNGGNAMQAVRLRGTTSLTGGNDPLIIVDGVMGDLTLLESVYPTDIESFTIMKDASQTAQYGSRGAAGVIEVTTRSGQAGRMRIGYNGTFGISSVYKRLDMLGADGYRQYIRQHGLTPVVDGGASTDFQKSIEQTGFVNQHHVALSGGGDKGNYRVSLGYMNEQEVIRHIGSHTLMSNMNMTQRMFDDRLRIDVGMFGSTGRNKSIFDVQKLFYSAAAWNPTLSDQRDADGNYAGYPSASQINNPMALLDEKNHTENLHLATHAKLTWDILPGLKAMLFGAYTYDVDELLQYLPSSVWNKGQATRGTDKHEHQHASLTLTYDRTWQERHTLSAAAMAEMQGDRYHGYQTMSIDFGDNTLGYDNLGAGAQRPYGGTGSYRNEATMVSFMEKLSYTYDGRYTLAFTLRSDGSSKFGDNHKWGHFPSVSLSWQMGRETWLKDVTWLDGLTLNAGYGISGNQGAIDSYTTLSLLRPSGLVPAGNGTVVTFSDLKNTNPELQWEKTSTFNAGIDATLLGGRLVASASWYRSHTEDMLYPYNVAVPPFRYPKLVANLGEMRNTGVEISLGGTPLKTRDVELTVNANLSLPHNRLLSLGGEWQGENLIATDYNDLSTVTGAGQHGNDNVAFQIIGQPLGTFYLPRFTGFVDDGTGGRDYGAGDMYICGQATPKALLGSNISLRYRDFDLTVQANGAFGHKVYNGTSLSYMNLGSLPLYNVLAKAVDENIHDQTLTDYWLENADYLNIDYITLAWRVPIPQGKAIESMRLTLTMNNVATITGYSGLTPMVNSSNVNDRAIGLDDKRTYPLYHTYTLGLSLSF